MSLKQKEIKFKPRIKLNHNIYLCECVSQVWNRLLEKSQLTCEAQKTQINNINHISFLWLSNFDSILLMSFMHFTFMSKTNWLESRVMKISVIMETDYAWINFITGVIMQLNNNWLPLSSNPPPSWSGTDCTAGVHCYWERSWLTLMR